MAANWLETKADAEARQRSSDFWMELRADLDHGVFWADQIKDLRGDPATRLQLALGNLPLPAAFREAAIATRALIREKRRSQADYSDLLALLYWLAAVDSFRLDYAPRLQEPGFNVAESMPGQVLKSLPYAYGDLGYRHLPLLTKTDAKWMVAAWGEPASHTTLNATHRSVWDDYESKLLTNRRRATAQAQAELRRLSDGD